MKQKIVNVLMWLLGASKNLAKFLEPVLEETMAQMLSDLAPIAIDVVTGLADSSKTGPEKQRAAVDEIKAQLIKSGIKATANAINLSVELAVAKLQEASAKGAQ